jgi:DNA repair exonuclease SbcCD ATPase subunit
MTEPVTQTKVNSLAISMLKNLKNLEELSFEGSELTAIMGPNGCGKTTILLL